jgi:general secretion pathway protein G
MNVKVAFVILSLLSFGCRDSFICRFNARCNRETALRHDLFEMRKAIDDFRADKQRYPEDLGELVRNHYLRTVPTDPLTGSASSWILVKKGGGLVDIRSAAKGTGYDGTEYQTW